MKLLDEIIDNATTDTSRVAPLLRRCLVLAYELKNAPFKQWVEKELNGYDLSEELPDYRKSYGSARGLFLGPLGATLDKQPLAASVLSQQHRHWARDIELRQPIAAYDTGDIKDAILTWPADLVVLYQTKFLQGWVLNRAWLDIPSSLLVAMVDAIRTRVLMFSLEIGSNLPQDASSSLDEIPRATVDQLVQVVIYGGNNVFGSVQEFSPLVVNSGDMQSLEKQLKNLGLTTEEVSALESSLAADASEHPKGTAHQTLGTKTASWIASAAKKVGGGASKITGAVAEEAIKAAVMKYLGL